ISEAELKALELSADETKRIKEVQKNASAKFQDTIKKLGTLGDKVRWVHLETAPPQCQPADATGAKQDLLKYTQGTLTYINEADNKPADLLTGEMILVGQSWRIIDAPVPSDDATGNAGGGAPVSQELQKLLDKLKAHDDKAPRPDEAPTVLAQYNL